MIILKKRSVKNTKIAVQFEKFWFSIQNLQKYMYFEFKLDS